MVARLIVTAIALVALWFAVALATQAVAVVGIDGMGDVIAFECGRRLPAAVPGSAEPLLPVEVALVLDEEWRDHFGADAESEARLIATRASGHYRNLGIHLLPVRIVSWESGDQTTTLTGLLADAGRDGLLGRADVVLVFTAQKGGGPEDGDAEVGGRFAIVRHNHEHRGEDEFVLAHELGHVFGAHHGCDVTGLAGLMADQGIELPLRICPCTRRAIEVNVARFHG